MSHRAPHDPRVRAPLLDTPPPAYNHWAPASAAPAPVTFPTWPTAPPAPAPVQNLRAIEDTLARIERTVKNTQWKVGKQLEDSRSDDRSMRDLEDKYNVEKKRVERLRNDLATEKKKTKSLEDTIKTLKLEMAQRLAAAAAVESSESDSDSDSDAPVVKKRKKRTCGACTAPDHYRGNPKCPGHKWFVKGQSAKEHIKNWNAALKAAATLKKVSAAADAAVAGAAVVEK